MKRFPIFIILFVAFPGSLSYAQESGPVSKSLKDRTQRGTLADRSEKVRGDSGKWRDDASLLVAPSLAAKPARLSLDAWADQLAIKEIKPTAGGDSWLIFRTRQLDDNDRLWIEKIERTKNRITVVLTHAVWQGNYSKNFTWYGVLGVNLGKLPPGDYRAKWMVQPKIFQQFEDPANRRASWPKDERAAGDDAEPEELAVSFSVAE